MRKIIFGLCPKIFGVLILSGLASVVIGENERAPSDQLVLVGPGLAAASNFGHGWVPMLFNQAVQLGVTDFRDIIYWQSVEREPGVFDFDKPETTYAKEIGAAGGHMSLTVNWGNEFYDDGHTPYTQEGRVALGKFVSKALDQFPEINAVEIGNEFNGQNFVSGPILDIKREDRAAIYFEILKSVYLEVKAHHPEVEVLGGAVHSIPAGYLWALLNLGGADYMDALVLHPYTTQPEQLMRQIAVLRRHPKARALPIQVTEFGHKSRTVAPGFLVRTYCALALSGIERVVWYPLSDRGDELQPLIDPLNGRPTAVGRAFAFVQDNLAGLPVKDVSPDPYTYACLFGENHLVIWGEPRAVVIADDVDAANATGVTLDPVLLRLSMTEPLLISSDNPIVIGENVQVEASDIIADSYHQFAFPEDGDENGPADPFLRFAQRGERSIPLVTMPGQESPGTIWTPYLGNRYIRPSRLTAESTVITGAGEDAVEIVHRYTADHQEAVAVEASWEPSGQGDGGIDITIQAGGHTLLEKTGVKTLEKVSLPNIELSSGENLDFIVGPGPESDRSLVAYRIVLRKAD